MKADITNRFNQAALVVPRFINMGVLTRDGLCLLWLAPTGPLTAWAPKSASP